MIISNKEVINPVAFGLPQRQINIMLATDKQIKYLTDLTNKVNHIIDIWPECGVEKFNVDWWHERTRGMGTNDASIRISAFHTLIRGVNMKRHLFGLKQF